MHYQVLITEQAKKDLHHIYSYILNVLKSKKNADSVLERLYTGMENLNCMPHRYHRYKNEPWFSRGIRFFSVDNYSVFYAIDDNTAVVTIIHIIYGKRDLDKVLSVDEITS